MQMFTLRDLPARRKGQIEPKVLLRRRDYRGFLLGLGEAEGPTSLNGRGSLKIKDLPLPYRPVMANL